MIDDDDGRASGGSERTDPSGFREASRPMDSREARERRLKIRCWRRGTKEMDLILGGFFDRCGAALNDAQLAAFEEAIREDDDRLYRWVSGAEATPPRHEAIIAAIRADRGV
ncbi:MAG: succinate dehydrogenase assembly factor 2 [Pseudomonadota bacterium]